MIKAIPLSKAFIVLACLLLTGRSAFSGPPVTMLGGPNRIDSGVVVRWNALAYEIAFAEDQFFTFKGHRACSMMHLAIHASIVPV
jgi:hypothetical protein